MLYRFWLVLIVAVLRAVAAPAQATVPAVAAIQVECQRIWSSRATYQTRSLDLGVDAEGTAYYAGESLKLLAVVYYGETGKWETYYYYKQGQLLFALSSDCRYNRPYYYDKKTARENGDAEAFDAQKSETTKRRYYFQRGQLIQWLDNAKKRQPPTAASQQEDYRELLATEARVRAELKK